MLAPLPTSNQHHNTVIAPGCGCLKLNVQKLLLGKDHTSESKSQLCLFILTLKLKNKF